MKPCSLCKEDFPEDDKFYSTWMWTRNDEERKCNHCSRGGNKDALEERKCKVCKASKSKTHFSDHQWYRVGKKDRKCQECCISPTSPLRQGHWTCVANLCKKTFPKHMFLLWMNDAKKDKRDHTQVCNGCFVKRREEREAMQRSNVSHVQKHKKG